MDKTIENLRLDFLKNYPAKRKKTDCVVKFKEFNVFCEIKKEWANSPILFERVISYVLSTMPLKNQNITAKDILYVSVLGEELKLRPTTNQ